MLVTILAQIAQIKTTDALSCSLSKSKALTKVPGLIASSCSDFAFYVSYCFNHNFEMDM